MKTALKTRVTRPILSAAVLGATLAAVLLALGYLLVQGGPDDTIRADDSSDLDHVTVRIAAMRTDSGAVQVGAQSDLGNGQWSERVLPLFRVISAEAAPGRWLHSSPIELPVAVRDDAMPEATLDSAAEDGSPGPLFCLVSHGQRDDYFWRLLRGNARHAALASNLNLRIYSSPDGEEQAEAIRRCSADEAVVIAATLANPDAVGQALLDARENGARIVTYNSGVEFAGEVGSEFHLALDDTGVGGLAGEQFVERGVSGDIGCLIHEEPNVGLVERCEALAETYTGGEVHMVRLPQGASDEAIGLALGRRLISPTEPRLEALLALNGQTLNIAMGVVTRIQERGGRVVRLASVGQTPALLLRHSEEVLRRHLVFITSSLVGAQGSLIVGAMQMVHTTVLRPQLFGNTIVLTGTPVLFQVADTPDDAAAVRESLRELNERLQLGDIIDE